MILPDVRGLYRFYEELALRFAERGYAALALDYFGRTAGVEKRGDDFEYWPHVEAVDAGGDPDRRRRCRRASALARRDVRLHGRLLHGRPPVLARRCGRARSRGRGRLLRAAGRSADGSPGPVQRASQIEAPILALQAGADQNITAEHNEAFERALSEAGVEHELVVYEGAPHSFFDRKQDEFAAASEDAWTRVLEFVERHGT